MVRRWLAALAVLVLLLAACSKDDRKPRSTASPAASPSPSVSASPSPTPSVIPSPAPSVAASARPSPSPSRRPAATTPAPPAPPTSAPSDQVRQPVPGDYVFDLTGTSTGLSATPQPYPPGATQTIRVGPGTAVAGGTEYEANQSSPQEPNVQTTIRTRWEPDKVLLVSTLLRLGALSNFPCTYNPPPTLVHIPPVTETFPQQPFGPGDCTGTVDVSVAGPETVAATGRAWRTWKVHYRSTFQMGVGLTGTIDTTMWLAPELGQAVKAETAVDAQFLASRLSARQSTVLRSHP
jgi:hypothetical protein